MSGGVKLGCGAFAPVVMVMLGRVECVRRPRMVGAACRLKKTTDPASLREK